MLLGMTADARLGRSDRCAATLAQAGLGASVNRAQPASAARAGHDRSGSGVDAQNPNGALRLYEGMGCRVIKQSTLCKKPMD